ncbi:MAG: HAD family phosphatase [Parcubacteria group bacterium]|nr:HAD family phosphatase [Parcubacteria group bacterium]
MSAQKRRVAVFDVDGTIFRSSLFIQLTERLIERGHVPEEMRRLYAREQAKWVNREGTYDDYIHAMVRASDQYFKGIYYGDFRDAAQYVVEAQWKHVYRYTRDLIKELKSKGYYLLAVSHSPKTILDFFCPRLGFNKVYGIIYEIGPEDRLTGRLADEHIIFNKATTLKRAVEKENLTLVHSIGVGDSETDIPFLEMVAKPICFNPSNKLYRHAKRNKWNVVVERKDVIYEI